MTSDKTSIDMTLVAAPPKGQSHCQRSVLLPRKRTLEHQGQFWQQIGRFYASEQFCDLDLHCSDSRVVKCHKMVMTSVSGLMERLLLNTGVTSILEGNPTKKKL